MRPLKNCGLLNGACIDLATLYIFLKMKSKNNLDDSRFKISNAINNNNDDELNYTDLKGNTLLNQTTAPILVFDSVEIGLLNRDLTSSKIPPPTK